MRELKFKYTCVRSNGFVFSRIMTLQEIENGDAKRWEEANITMTGLVYKRQYTGLKDSKGKDIYEGDVIAYNSCGLRLIAWIIWNEYCGAWHYQYRGATGGDPCDYLERIIHNTRFPAEVEVIGNVYESPELLKTE